MLHAANDEYPTVPAFGIDINPAYVARAAQAPANVRVEVGDFFSYDWDDLFQSLPSPLLIIGNPPWVTNADLSAVGSSNLPTKENFAGRTGIAAITGKSNFDISEWLMIRLTEAVLKAGAFGRMAFLCKLSVARKFLTHAWGRTLAVGNATVYKIDAKRHFNASVDACLLTFEIGSGRDTRCRVMESLQWGPASSEFGMEDGQIVADVAAYRQVKRFVGASPWTWRSGVKHDCAKVMQLLRVGSGQYQNGLGDLVELESDYIFPMFKSSNVASLTPETPSSFMIVPQTTVGEDTLRIRIRAPKTWAYLNRYKAMFDKRGSSIYRNKPPFSVFGVGDYTFSRWKVAISGLYKRLAFRVVGPFEDRPVVFDDTVYVAACESEAEAVSLFKALQTAMATNYFKAFVFWDAKRPITAEILNRLDIAQLGAEQVKRVQPCSFGPLFGAA